MELLNSIELKSEYRSLQYNQIAFAINVAKWLINKRKEVIFGGFVRDLILLSNNMKKFKEEYPKEDFWNPKFGKFKERIVQFNNIDVAYYDKNVTKIVPDNLFKSKFALSAASSSNAQKWNIYTKDTRVVSYKATAHLWKYYSKTEISCYINFLCFNNKPFACREDLECNMLCISSSNTNCTLISDISTHIDNIPESQRKEQLNRIVSDIAEKKTRTIPLYTTDRKNEDYLIISVNQLDYNKNSIYRNPLYMNEISNMGGIQLMKRAGVHLLFAEYAYAQDKIENKSTTLMDNRLVRVIPYDDRSGNNMNPEEVNMKIIRLERVIKMLMKGWKIENITSFSRFHPIPGYKYGTGYYNDPYHGCTFEGCPHVEKMIEIEKQFEEEKRHLKKKSKVHFDDNLFSRGQNITIFNRDQAEIMFEGMGWSHASCFVKHCKEILKCNVDLIMGDDIFNDIFY